MPHKNHKRSEVGMAEQTSRGRPTSLAADIVKEYLKKYPQCPSLTIAKMLAKEVPELFPHAKSAFEYIRYYRGIKGKRCRKEVKDKSFFTAKAFKKLLDEEEIDSSQLPPSDYDKDWGALTIKTKRCLILCDIHIPYQCQNSLEIAIRFGLEYSPDTIIINGDLVDHYNLSEFVKDPRAKDFAYERKCTLQFLSYLRERFPNSRIIWKEGNHEFWYFRYMMKNNGALMGVKYFHIESVYRLQELNIEYVKDNRPIEIASLWILHGHELQKNPIGVPVNPARSVYLKAATTMLVGHHHITSEHTTQNAKGEIITTWSVGCLSGLRPPYARFSKYNNGFATVDCDGKTFHVSNRKIYKGKII